MIKTDNPTQTVVKAKRIKYGFELNFPNEFTIRDLRKAKNHKVKYITISIPESSVHLRTAPSWRLGSRILTALAVVERR